MGSNLIVVEIDVPGLDAPEIEQAITIPLERAFDWLSSVAAISSTTTWQNCRVVLRFDGPPSQAVVEQVTAVVHAESARFGVAASKPVISIGAATAC